MIKKIKEFLKNDRVERAIKTFIEGFCSYIVANIMLADLSDVSALKALIVGAIASAISFVINSLKKETFSEEPTPEESDGK